MSLTVTLRAAAPRSIALVKVTSANALAELRIRACAPPVPTKPPLSQARPAPPFKVTVSGVAWAAKPPPPVVPPQVIVPVPATMLAAGTKLRSKVPDSWMMPDVPALPSTSGLFAGRAALLLSASTPSCTLVCPV